MNQKNPTPKNQTENPATNSSIYDDSAIKEPKQDILGREKFAAHLGGAIVDWNIKESLVVGLYGEWGEGKSSIINLAKKHIEEKSEKLLAKKKPTIVEFNPWLFSNMENLVQQFFNEIGKKLGDETDEKFKKYASALSEIVPKEKKVFDLLLRILLDLKFLKGFPKISNWAENYLTSNKKSISQLKEEIIKEFGKRKNKLIVIIDDIDRLNQQEIRQIFQLVKSNANFPNTVYLLAFAREIVEKSLEQEHPGFSGRNYLEKIIQVGFDIPQADPTKIHTFLEKEIEEIFQTLPVKHFKKHRYDSRILSKKFFLDLFNNLRDVKRFVNGLRFNISQMHNGKVMEVNPFNFTIIEAIRFFAPELYRFIKENKNIFIKDKNNNYRDKNNNYRDKNNNYRDKNNNYRDKNNNYRDENNNYRDEKTKARLEKELEKTNSNNQDDLKYLICYLFPKVNGILKGIEERGRYVLYELKYFLNYELKEIKIYQPEHFAKYFNFIPGGGEGRLSQAEAEEILSSTSSVEKMEKLFNQYIEKEKDSKIERILEKLETYVDDNKHKKISDEDIPNVIQVLFNISDKILLLVYSYRIIEVINNIFSKKKLDQNECYKILENAINNCQGTQGIHLLIEIINYNNRPSFSLIKKESPKLKRLYIGKIKGLNEEELLIDNNAHNFLLSWKKWGKKQDLTAFMEKVKASPHLLCLFLSGFKTYDRPDDLERTATLLKVKNLEEINPRMEKAKQLAEKDKAFRDQHQEVINWYFKAIEYNKKP